MEGQGKQKGRQISSQILYILAFQCVKQTLRSKYLSGLKIPFWNLINEEVTTKINHKSRGTRPSPCVPKNLEVPQCEWEWGKAHVVNFWNLSILQTRVIRPRTTVLSPPTSGTLAGVVQPGYHFRFCSCPIQGLGKERGVWGIGSGVPWLYNPSSGCSSQIPGPSLKDFNPLFPRGNS